MLPDFTIQNKGDVSACFLHENVESFSAACDFVAQLPYGRNADKENFLTVFTDKCGTCSTKHALLKRLADENEVPGLQLMTGIFRMTAKNTPAASRILRLHSLDHIPEAHNYLRFGDQILDCTNRSSSAADFEGDLLTEIEIMPAQISNWKIAYHKEFLRHWLQEHDYPFTPDELWAIREDCISALSGEKHRE